MLQTIPGLNVVSKLWKTWTFSFSAKLHLSVNFFPPGFISEKPLQCLYCLLFGRSGGKTGRSCAVSDGWGLQCWEKSPCWCLGSGLTGQVHLSHLPQGDKSLISFCERESGSELYRYRGLQWSTESSLKRTAWWRLQVISQDDLSQQKSFY